VKRREFIMLLGGGGLRGRSPRARSSRRRWSGFSASRPLASSPTSWRHFAVGLEERF
jgi:hypothetical protein